MNSLNKRFLLSVLTTGMLASCSPSVTHIRTTESQPWQEVTDESSSLPESALRLVVNTSPENRRQTIEGFGACFNELGWVALSRLDSADRTAVMQELFAPGVGAQFTICRMPVGANDFSRDWYSYNETPGDFAMENFSIANDYETLIPFIRAARQWQPDLKLWASPWCPPSWMKHNGHYASVYTGEEYDPKYRNGLPADKVGYEGTDMFITEPDYMKAYALYFSKFIDAYAAEGIPIFGVMPQNEFNSPQIYPSCCWTARGLTEFIGNYLGPAMQEKGIDVMFGTVERANEGLVDTVLQDPKAGPYIKGVGFQWAGKGAIGTIHEKYPQMLLLQTEQECGDGKNCWVGMLHSWDLLKHYLDNGASIYDYWNIALDQGGISRWGWAQNSLVVVDPATAEYRYTLEYYLMKHISSFVRPGAERIALTGDLDEALAFRNPDGSIVVLCVEKEGQDKRLAIEIDGRTTEVLLAANSVNTFCF